jgi:hypothetical protein
MKYINYSITIECLSLEPYPRYVSSWCANPEIPSDAGLQKEKYASNSSAVVNCPAVFEFFPIFCNYSALFFSLMSVNTIK